MEKSQKIINFVKSDLTKMQIIEESIEKKEYWKALRLLNSILQENRDISVIKLAYSLHTKLSSYVGITDDLILLLTSNNPDAILIGAKGLIEFSQKNGEDCAKSYYYFVKNKLKPFFDANGKDVFNQLVGYDDNSSKIHFVEKQNKSYKTIEKIDKLMNEGDFDSASIIAASSTEQDSLIYKLQAESLLVKKQYRKAYDSLQKVQAKDWDIYYKCLKFRVEYHLKKLKKDDDKKLLELEIKYPEELIFVSEALFEAKQPNLVVEFIEKHENHFEFYYPMYFAKGIAYLNIKEDKKAKVCFKNSYILNPRQVAAKEICKLIDKRHGFGSKLSIHGAFPTEISKEVDKKYKKIMKLSDLDFSKLPIGQIEEMLYWLELYHGEIIIEQYLLRLIYCKNGIEAIKHALLSFQSSDWLKKQCIKILVFSGANDVDIFFTLSNTLKSVKLLVPTTLANETEVYENSFFSENINYEKIMMAYSMAYSELAFENNNFEKRLQEVANYCIQSILSLYSKQKSDKFSINLLASALLYASCSNLTNIEFKNKKVANSRFATFSTASSQFQISSEELKKFVKQIF